MCGEHTTCAGTMQKKHGDARGLHSVTDANERWNLGGELCRWKRHWACQSANQGSALVALRPLLTFWPWPWPKCQRSPIRVSGDHCKTLVRDASPWQHSAHFRRRDWGGVYAFCMLKSGTRRHTSTHSSRVQHLVFFCFSFWFFFRLQQESSYPQMVFGEHTHTHLK